jgi:hypothetical protein
MGMGRQGKKGWGFERNRGESLGFFESFLAFLNACHRQMSQWLGTSDLKD